VTVSCHSGFVVWIWQDSVSNRRFLQSLQAIASAIPLRLKRTAGSNISRHLLSDPNATLCHMNPVHTLKSHLLKTHFDFNLLFTPRFLLFRFLRTKICINLSSLPCIVSALPTSSTLILFTLITIFDQENELWRSSLSNFLKPPPTFSAFSP
jgi:hypothetical protein